VSDVKAEVNRSIELEELKKMKTQFEDAARNVEQTVRTEVNEAQSSFDHEWGNVTSISGGGTDHSTSLGHDPLNAPLPSYSHPKKNWRLKRGATPQWYKQRNGVRTKALSGAARVARFRPPGQKAPR
jgi:sec-independent protein translocase protein TatB